MHIEPDTPRKYKRIRFDRQVKLEFLQDTFYSRVNNLSLTGIFVKGNFQEYDDKYCLIGLYQSAESPDLSLRAAAEVVRKNDKGIALRFVSMPHDSIVFLQSSLSGPHGYPYAMPRDLLKSSATNFQFSN